MNCCCPTHCKNSQHFKKTKLYFYVFVEIYLLFLLIFYLLNHLYCCDCTLRFTSQIVACELTHSINLQFLLLNYFTAYWMCKHVSAAVHSTLPVSQGENSTIFPKHKLFSYFGCVPYSYGEKNSGRAQEELIL